MPRTVFPLHPSPPFNKGQNYPYSSSRIYIRKPVQAIDRIQVSIDARCLEACLACFKDEFESQAQKIDKRGRLIRAFMFDQCLIELVKHPNRGPHSQLWFFVGIHDPTTLAQEKVAEIIIMALDSLGLPHDHASVSQVEFALDFVPAYPAMLRELTDYLQSSLTMQHGRAGSCKMVETTLYVSNKGNVRSGTKGIRCYPKERNRVRVEVQANKPFLKGKGVTINSLPLVADRVNVMDYARLYHRLSAREVEQIIAKYIPTPANRQTQLRNRVRADAIGEALVVQQIDAIRRLSEKHERKFDKGRLFTEWKLLQMNHP